MYIYKKMKTYISSFSNYSCKETNGFPVCNTAQKQIVIAHHYLNCLQFVYNFFPNYKQNKSW